MSPTHKPDEMSLEDWQIRLRQDLAAKGRFRLKPQEKRGAGAWNFQIRNLDTDRVYRLEIRSEARYQNFCSCPDYAINTLGTCKHLEFTLRALRKKSLRKHALLRGVSLSESEIGVRYGPTRSLTFREGAKISARSRALVRDLFSEESEGLFLKEFEPSRFDQFVSKFRATGSPLRLREDAIEIIGDERFHQQARAKVHSLLPRGWRSGCWKDLLKVQLYPYQREGAFFAASRGRTLIADEMGLGKTVQALGATEILRRACGIKRVLIICPTSLKHQWRSEIERFSGQSVEIVEGSASRRRELLRSPSFFKIINYDLVHREIECLADWKPDYVILDEAQRIKNWKTKASQAVKRLNSPFCLVLTGTPLENRIEELHSLMEFVDRFRFGPLFRFLYDHQIFDEGGKVVGYGDLDKIHERLREVMVRRTKAQVLEQLPPRMDKTFLLPMTAEQMDVHAEQAHLVAQIVAKWKRFRFLNDRDQKRLMTALQFMRMSCNSTYLLEPKTNHQKKFTELGKVLNEVMAVKENKVVIFSQWLRTHELIMEIAEKKRWKFVYFHGSLSGPQRRQAIETFCNDSRCRLFLATDAGGVGLNLQAANVVINMDQPWNPAILDQRIGRIHRLGQKRPVQVLNFVSQNSIEEGMLRTLDFKRSVFSGVLDGARERVLLGGSRLQRFIENVEEATQAGARHEVSKSPLLPPKAERSEKTRVTFPVADMNPWGDILTAGAQLLRQLIPAGLPLELAGARPATSSSPIRIEQDEKTGEISVRLKTPPPEVIAMLAQALQNWLIPTAIPEAAEKTMTRETHESERLQLRTHESPTILKHATGLDPGIF